MTYHREPLEEGDAKAWDLARAAWDAGDRDLEDSCLRCNVQLDGFLTESEWARVQDYGM